MAMRERKKNEPEEVLWEPISLCHKVNPGIPDIFFVMVNIQALLLVDC